MDDIQNDLATLTVTKNRLNRNYEKKMKDSFSKFVQDVSDAKELSLNFIRSVQKSIEIKFVKYF